MKTNENRFISAVRSFRDQTFCLLRSLPVFITAFFIIDNLLMNVLAGFKIIDLPWLVINWAITVSWGTFMILDVVTKRFGPAAANILSVIAAIANLIAALVCFLLSKIFSNPLLDLILGGQWSVFTASTIAFIASSVLNNHLNHLIGKAFSKNPDGKAAYSARAFTSTFVSQFIDNFLFLFLAFFIFPMIPSALNVTYTVPQILSCAALFAIAELITEVIFAPVGYMTVKKWKEKGVGKEYAEKYNVEAN